MSGSSKPRQVPRKLACSQQYWFGVYWSETTPLLAAPTVTTDLPVRPQRSPRNKRSRWIFRSPFGWESGNEMQRAHEYVPGVAKLLEVSPEAKSPKHTNSSNFVVVLLDTHTHTNTHTHIYIYIYINSYIYI